MPTALGSATSDADVEHSPPDSRLTAADSGVYETAKARIAQYETDPTRKAILEQILDIAFDQQ